MHFTQSHTYPEREVCAQVSPTGCHRHPESGSSVVAMHSRALTHSVLVISARQALNQLAIAKVLCRQKIFVQCWCFHVKEGRCGTSSGCQAMVNRLNRTAIALVILQHSMKWARKHREQSIVDWLHSTYVMLVCDRHSIHVDDISHTPSVHPQ